MSTSGTDQVFFIGSRVTGLKQSLEKRRRTSVCSYRLRRRRRRKTGGELERKYMKSEREVKPKQPWVLSK